MINPMVLDGQIQGGVAQGIGTALYEQLAYDENGQFLTGTLMDYLAATAPGVPTVEIGPIESPFPYTPLGIKGMGEGAAIAPPQRSRTRLLTLWRHSAHVSMRFR